MRALTRQWLALAPVWLGLIAMLVSAPAMAVPSKWSDEGATISAATRSLPDLWRMLHLVDAVHGFFYLLMHFWVGAFGTSALAIRMPSLIAIGIATAGVAVLGRLLAGERLMIAGALVFAVLPRVTWLAMEGRSYAGTAAIAVWASVLFVRAVRGGGIRWWIGYTALVGAGLLLNVYLALMLVVHAATAVSWWRSTRRPARALLALVGAGVIAVGIGLPAILLSSRETGQVSFGRFTAAYVGSMFGIEQYFTGATPVRDRLVHVPPTTIWAAAAVALAVIGWALMVWGAWRIRRRGDHGSPAALLVGWIAVPVLILFAVSAFVTNLYTARYLSFTTPAAALLIAAGVLAIPRFAARLVVVVLIAALALPVYVYQRIPTAKQGTDWAGAAQIVATAKLPGDSVYWGRQFGGVLGQNDARIGYTYPDEFAGLHSVTLVASPDASGTLWGVDRLLGRSIAQVDAASRIWVIGDHLGRPSWHPQRGGALLQRQGMRLERQWLGVATDVFLWVRE